jgi:uncharacterized protein YrzB (UPF0473 family)
VDNDRNLETILIEDEEGNEQEYDVDAVIEMDQIEYVLYSQNGDIQMKRIEREDDEEVLLNVTEEEMEKLFAAYQQALKEDVSK